VVCLSLHSGLLFYDDKRVNSILINLQTKMEMNVLDRPQKPSPHSGLQKHQANQIPVWMSLAQAMNNARSKLKGEDLELFERLIVRPRSTVNSPIETINEWTDGDLAPLS
jgi:hypothetical protein